MVCVLIVCSFIRTKCYVNRSEDAQLNTYTRTHIRIDDSSKPQTTNNDAQLATNRSIASLVD